jgi:DNA-binding PadR family transcriptional regulator
VYQVLLSLSDQHMHGYAILKDIEDRTQGDVLLAAGTLYAVLARLKRDGWIVTVGGGGDVGGDSRRQYYEITTTGTTALREEVSRLRRSIEMAEVKRIFAADG